MTKRKNLKVTVFMYIESDDTPCKVETTCEARNVDFLWGSITAQCEDVDKAAEEDRAFDGIYEPCDRCEGAPARVESCGKCRGLGKQLRKEDE